jgi:hypothetical protein
MHFPLLSSQLIDVNIILHKHKWLHCITILCKYLCYKKLRSWQNNFHIKAQEEQAKPITGMKS